MRTSMGYAGSTAYRSVWARLIAWSAASAWSIVVINSRLVAGEERRMWLNSSTPVPSASRCAHTARATARPSMCRWASTSEASRSPPAPYTRQAWPRWRRRPSTVSSRSIGSESTTRMEDWGPVPDVIALPLSSWVRTRPNLRKGTDIRAVIGPSGELAGVNRDEVPVGGREIAVGGLGEVPHLGGRGVRRVLQAVVRHERRPARVDVEFHAVDRAGRLEQLRQRVHGQLGAADIHNVALGGHPHARTGDVVPAVDRVAPVGPGAVVLADHDVAVVHQHVEVLPYGGDVRGHRQVAAPLADLDRAVLVEDLGGLAVHQRDRRAPVLVEAAHRVVRVHLEAAVPGGDEAGADLRGKRVRLVPGAAGLVVAGVQGEGEGVLVEPADVRQAGGVVGVRAQRGGLDDRVAERAEDGRREHALARDTPGRHRGDVRRRVGGRGLEVLPHAVRALLLGLELRELAGVQFPAGRGRGVRLVLQPSDDHAHVMVARPFGHPGG